MNSVLRSSFLVVLVLIACAALTVTALAQSAATGAIAGAVTDQSKAVVVGATVTVRNVDTGAQHTATTDSSGRFRVVQLQPGTYGVTAKAPSFAASKEDLLIVEVSRISELEIVLGIGSKAEQVTVESAAPMVNTEEHSFSSNINSKQIDELPINGRRWSNFVLLMPGSGMDGNFGLISFRGISGLMNNSTVDGGDNNQAFFGEERGRTRAQYVVSQSSVREFQVTTQNYSAEYGRAAGAVVNTVTKSGTNRLHGQAFWYIRDNALGAYNPLATLTTKDATGTYVTAPFKPEDRRNQFGGNLGGPIVKDKLFFFFNYDGQRQNMPGVATPSGAPAFFSDLSTADQTTLAQHMYATGSNTCTSASLTPCYNTNNSSSSNRGKYYGTPSAAQLAAAAAAFNDARTALNGMTGEQPRNSNQDVFFPKLDWRITPNHTLAMSYNRMRRWAESGVQQGVLNLNRGLQDWGNDNVKVEMLNVRLSSALSSKLSNEFRYSWGRDFEFQRSQTPNPIEAALAATATVPAYGGFLPETQIGPSSSRLTIGRPYYLERYAYPDERRHQWAETMTFSVGKHLLKFGVDLSRVNDLMDHLYEGGGSYSYSNRLAFLEDMGRAIAFPADAGRGCTGRINNVWTTAPCYSGFYQTTGPSAWKFNTWDYALFFQDDFRVLPRLTLSFGLRWEYEQLPSPQAPNPDLPLTTKFPSDKNNFGPRFGFALDVFGDGKTALRGGYGIYYGRIINSTVADMLFKTGSPSGQQTYSIKPYDPLATTGTTPLVIWPNVLPRAVTAKADTVMFGPNVQTPQIHQADLILEHEIAKDTVMSVSYLMSLGREMMGYTDTNISPSTWSAPVYILDGPLAGTNFLMPVYQTRINPNYGRISYGLSNVNSNYNALVAQVNRRMRKGLQFQASYTWAHAFDTGQTSQTFTPSSGTTLFDPYNPKGEYGTSNFDVRHRIVGNMVWEPQYFKNKGGVAKALGYGWGIAPIFTFSGGVPFSEYISGYPSLPTGMSYVASSFNESGGSSRLAPVLARNSYRLPWIQNIDLRLSRKFRITEGHSLQVMAEAFNLFNHTQVLQQANTLYFAGSYTTGAPATCTSANPCTKLTAPGPTDTAFGTPSSAMGNLYRERQIQFAVRYSF